MKRSIRPSWLTVGVSLTELAMHAHRGRQLIGKALLGIVATSAHLRVVFRQSFVEKKPFAKRNLRRCPRIIGAGSPIDRVHLENQSAL